MAIDFQEWILLPVRWSVTVVFSGPRIWWRLFTDSKTSAVSTVLMQTIGILLAMAAARFLGEVKYGDMAALSTCVNWFTVIYGFPTAALIARFVADGRRDDKPFERKCAASFWLGMGFATVAALASIAFLPFGLPYYGVDGMWLSGFMFSLTYLSSFPISYCLFLLQSFGRMKLWAALSVANSASFLVCVVFMVLVFPPLTIDRYFGSILTGNVVVGLTSVAICIRLLGFGNLLHPDFSVTRAILRAGRGGWVASIFANTSLLGLNTMIVRLVGKTELGYYQLVNTIGTWVYNVVVSVTIPALADWSETASDGRYWSLRRNFRFRQLGTASLSIFAGTIAFVFAPDILGLIYGEAYRSGAGLLRLSVVSWVTLGLGCWYWYVFTAVGYPGRVMLPNVVWGTLQLVVGYVFMTWITPDAYGAMMAYVVAYIGWVAMYEIVYQRTWRKLGIHPVAAEEVSG